MTEERTAEGLERMVRCADRVAHNLDNYSYAFSVGELDDESFDRAENYLLILADLMGYKFSKKDAE